MTALTRLVHRPLLYVILAQLANSKASSPGGPTGSANDASAVVGTTGGPVPESSVEEPAGSTAVDQVPAHSIDLGSPIELRTS